MINFDELEKAVTSGKMMTVVVMVDGKELVAVSFQLSTVAFKKILETVSAGDIIIPDKPEKKQEEKKAEPVKAGTKKETDKKPAKTKETVKEVKQEKPAVEAESEQPQQESNTFTRESILNSSTPEPEPLDENPVNNDPGDTEPEDNIPEGVDIETGEVTGDIGSEPDKVEPVKKSGDLFSGSEEW